MDKATTMRSGTTMAKKLKVKIKLKERKQTNKKIRNKRQMGKKKK